PVRVSATVGAPARPSPHRATATKRPVRSQRGATRASASVGAATGTTSWALHPGSSATTATKPAAWAGIATWYRLGRPGIRCTGIAAPPTDTASGSSPVIVTVAVTARPAGRTGGTTPSTAACPTATVPDAWQPSGFATSTATGPAGAGAARVRGGASTEVAPALAPAGAPAPPRSEPAPRSRRVPPQASSRETAGPVDTAATTVSAAQPPTAGFSIVAIPPETPSGTDRWKREQIIPWAGAGSGAHAAGSRAA